MGYHEQVCQLCGISFCIARCRRADEPDSAAWDSSGGRYVFVDDIGEPTCGPDDGCYLRQRELRFPGWPDSPDQEHIAGPGCCFRRGYSGYQISVEEMRSCRAVRCLRHKRGMTNWQDEPDDASWERETS
jgi:hypothetical protein